MQKSRKSPSITADSEYLDALRRVRRQASGASTGYASELFKTGWDYCERALPELEARDRSTSKFASPADSPKIPTEESKTKNVTEKTKVMDSLHEFAKKQLEETGKDSFSFPGGEVKKKSAPTEIFQGLSGKTMNLEALKKVSSDIDVAFSQMKFSLRPKTPLSVLFVADESSDLNALNPDGLDLEAFFDAPAAALFERMMGAMQLEEGHAFVTSLKVLRGSHSDSFEEGVLQEIYNLKPKIVVSLGGGATGALLGQGFSLQKSHGQFFEKEVPGEEGPFNFEVMPLFSPAFLVEAPNTKRIAWEDMQKAMKKLRD